MARMPLILLPGMMCDRRLFAPQIAAFSAGYDVIVPHLAENSIHQMAQKVLRGAPPGPLSVAGLSMGGIVAMEMAALAPDRLRRVALLNTTHHSDAAGRFDIRNRQIADVKDGHLRAVIVEEMKPLYLAPANRARRDLLDLLIDMAMDVGPDVFVSQSLALRDRLPQTGSLARYGGPCLILCGESDQLCPRARHVEMAGLMHNARLEILPATGHISTLESPDRVNAALRRWLAW